MKRMTDQVVEAKESNHTNSASISVDTPTLREKAEDEIDLLIAETQEKFAALDHDMIEMHVCNSKELEARTGRTRGYVVGDGRWLAT